MKTKPEFKRHRIFASGVHRKDKHEEAVWSAERVQSLFERSKELSPAQIPYTYRHPENGLPVLGWADRESLQVVEDGGRTYLTAVPKELAVEFMQGLKDVGYDQVSIGIGQKGEIVHIGVTDKERTAVSGLGPVFERSDSIPPVYVEEVTFEAEDLGGGLDSSFEVSWKWQLQSWMSEVAGLFQRMREQKIEADGLEAADKFLPAYVTDFLKRDLPADEPAAAEPALSTFESDDMTDEQKREFERLQAFEAEQLQKAAAALVESRKAAVTQFCADNPEIVTDKIRPQVVALLTALQQVEAPATFEAGGAQVSKSAFELGCDLIAGMPKAVSFERDVAGAGKGPDGGKADARPLSQQADAATAEKVAGLA